MASGELTLAIVADVFIDRPEPASIFADCGLILREADIAFANLEGVYTNRGTPIVGKIDVGSRHLRSDPKNIEGFAAAGIDVVSLANNHIMDWGPEALLQSIELLDKMGIAHCGGGRDIAEARKPAILERSGTRVAFLSYTSVFVPGYTAGQNSPGCVTVGADTTYLPAPNTFYQPGFPPIIRTFPNQRDLEMVVGDVKKAKSQADVVIVSWHWGIYPGIVGVKEYQKVVARAAIDAGADLIAGHHPHMLHGMEFYKDKLICYSLGHFAFDVPKGPFFGNETLILKCYIRNKKIERVTFVPCLINDEKQPIVLDPKKGQPVIQMVEDWSAEFNIGFTPEGKEVVIRPRKAAPAAKAVEEVGRPAAEWMQQALGLRPRR